MPKLQIKANELVGVDASFVSLVKRGANRIPFRITKEDEPMLDLHKLGRNLFKKSDPKPEIVAAVVQTGADLSKVAAVFKSAGLDPKTFVRTEQGGVTTLAKADADLENAATLQVSDDVAIVVSGLKKSFDSYAYNSTDFGVVMATEGVHPSMCVAKDALASTISNILYRAASPAEAVDMISTAIDAFKGYMVMLLGAVPMTAFKADIAFGQASVPAASDEAPVVEAEAGAEELEKADAGKNGTGAGVVPGKGTGTSDHATADDKAKTVANAKPGENTTGNAEDMPAKTKKADIAGLPDPEGFEPGDADGFAAAPTDSQGATARGSADDKKMKQNGGTTGSSIPDGNAGMSVQKAEGDADIGKKGKGKTLPDTQSGAGAQTSAMGQDLKDVTKSDNSDILAAIAELRKSFDSAVGEVRNEVGALSERVDAVASKARKTEEALNGTVFAEPAGDTERVAKSDSSLPPLLDTAYARS